MARVGFKKSYAAGNFDNAAIQALHGHIKTYLINAGFNVIIDAANAIDVVRMGFPAGTANDDVPHWAFVYENQAPYGALIGYSVYGHDYLASDAYANLIMLVHTGWLPNPSPPIDLWFAADGVEGWWWLHGIQADPSSATGVSMSFATAGTTSRRYPADTHQGLCARYAIWDNWGDWQPPYSLDENGNLNTRPWSGTWSLFGQGWTFNAERHSGSPLPRMAVPQFPNKDRGITACILGEINEILVLTNGYTQEEIVVPGWIAMTGSDTDQPYAVPAPAQFDVL